MLGATGVSPRSSSKRTQLEERSIKPPNDLRRDGATGSQFECTIHLPFQIVWIFGLLHLLNLLQFTKKKHVHYYLLDASNFFWGSYWFPPATRVHFFVWRWIFKTPPPQKKSSWWLLTNLKNMSQIGSFPKKNPGKFEKKCEGFQSFQSCKVCTEAVHSVAL